MAFGSQAPRCPRCTKSVYPAEMKMGPEGPWHSKCFKCWDCKRGLEITTMYERDHEIFCRTCFKRGPGVVPPAVNSTAAQAEYAKPEQHGYGAAQQTAAPARPPRTLAAGGAAQPAQAVPHTPPRAGYAGLSGHKPVDISPSSVFGSGRRNLNLPASRDMCPRCTKPIYHAEKVVGPGGPWHRACFKCKQCSTTLDSSKLTEHDGEAFCRSCYTKLFSPRGYNIGGSMEPLPYQQHQQPHSPSDRGERSARAPSSLAAYRQSSPSPAQWADDPAHNPFGSAVGAAASAAVQGQNRAIPAPHFGGTVSRAESSQSRLSFGRQYTPAVSVGLSGPPPDMCPRCNGRIYAAEQGMAAGRKYHKRCIRCRACDAPINSLQLTERDNDIYCKQCYAKHFGPQGFRPAMSAPTNHH